MDGLRAAKLRALVADNFGVVGGVPSALPGGAAFLSLGRAFVLIDDGVVGRFGGALAWAVRAGASSLDVLVDGPSLAAGVVARRAGAFSFPLSVWSVEGRSVLAAAPAPFVDASAEAPPPADLVELLSAHGLEVVWEHGVLRGEVLGLEVARTVGGELEVGVGRHDRMARFEMRRSESLSSALEESAAAVRSLRSLGAPAHPANRLARSRWLRSVVVSSPGSVGLAEGVVPVAPPLPWFDLPEAGPAPCVGVSAPLESLESLGSSVSLGSSGSSGSLGSLGSSGERVVAVCSVGVDLDLVPTAADCRLMYGVGSGAGSGEGGAELWVVVPAGDDLPILYELASFLDPLALVITVPHDWEAGW